MRGKFRFQKKKEKKGDVNCLSSDLTPECAGLSSQVIVIRTWFRLTSESKTNHILVKSISVPYYHMCSFPN